MGPTALIILRVLEGFSSVNCLKRKKRNLKFYFQGFIYPSLHAIWSKWAPKNDKSKLATFAFSGKST
jgi:MFS family permease